MKVLESLADPEDADGDGVSGRVRWLMDAEGRRVPGRFAWKAEQPTVKHQSAAAFRGDMGITSPLQPEEDLTDVQRQQIEFVSGGDPEIDAHKLDRLAFYTAALAVPARRSPQDPVGQRGERLFTEIGCAACHRPTLVTGAEAPVPGYENQTFHPFTDLLLHDMGPGTWRMGSTPKVLAPPNGARQRLWGIGLLQTVNGHTRLLHDGRARSIEEAILWHGGEASGARDRFTALRPKTVRLS